MLECICGRYSLTVLLNVVVKLYSHGLSYPISGLVKSYYAKDYDTQKPLVV